VFKLPDSLAFEKAAAIEPVSVAVHAVGLTPVRLGDTAVVVGTGMAGLLIVQALRLAGCGRVITLDGGEAKLTFARQLGADDCINPSHSDAPAFVRGRTEVRGYCGRSGRRDRASANCTRLGSQRRHSDTGRQHHSQDRVTASIGGHPAGQANRVPDLCGE
jgi:D-arabinose 1-dehydrogenase-like Zn-dependent alcohol dehydrogenase